MRFQIEVDQGSPEVAALTSTSESRAACRNSTKESSGLQVAAGFWLCWGCQFLEIAEMPISAKFGSDGLLAKCLTNIDANSEAGDSVNATRDPSHKIVLPLRN